MRAILSLALPALLLAGCVSPRQEIVNEENLLSASGFEPRPANTPERLTMLQKLPPNRFAMKAHGNTYTYIYPDPIGCGCVYFGDQADYARYRQTISARRLANDQLLAASEYQDASWNWGPWGGFGPGFGPGFGY